VSLTTTTGNEQEVVLPRLSVAVQVTVVVPTGNGPGEGGTHVTLTVTPGLGQRLDAVTLNGTLTMPSPQSQPRTGERGQLIAMACGQQQLNVFGNSVRIPV